jgi:phosphoglycerol transferase
MPADASIFQLPVAEYPWFSPGLGEMTEYDLLKPYLHSTDLRWSHGATRGRPDAEWQSFLATYPTHVVVQAVAAVGFEGLYVNRVGYPDRGRELEAEVARLLDAEPITSIDGTLVFFDLQPYRDRLRSRLGATTLDEIRTAAVQPVTATWGPWACGLEQPATETWRYVHRLTRS